MDITEQTLSAGVETQIAKSYSEPIAQAKILMGIPTNVEISGDALATALGYLGDLNYMLKQRIENAEMGLSMPRTLSGEFNWNLEIIDQAQINLLRKQLRRIFTSEERVQILECNLSDMIAQELNTNIEISAKVSKAFISLRQNKFEFSDDLSLIRRMVRSLEVEGRVNFLSFVCPENNFSALQSEYPVDYLRSSMKGSLLERQIPDYEKVSEIMNKFGIKTNLITLVGDDDSAYLIPFYLFPDVEIVDDKVRIRSNENRAELAKKVFQKLSLKKNPFSELQVISLGESKYEISNWEIDLWQLFDRISENPAMPIINNQAIKLFDEKDVETEIVRMTELFNTFYSELVEIVGRFPTDVELRRIVNLKFAIYSIQGLYAQGLNQNLILLQTEKPQQLRDKMINGGLRLLSLPEFPSIYL